VTYTLRGDRNVEYGFAGARIPQAPPGGRALDLGCGPRAAMAKHMVKMGWQVIGVDLLGCDWQHERFTFIPADFNHLSWDRPFDLAVAVSALEHFGVPGRYGVKAAEDEADLVAAACVNACLKPGGLFILTVPVGLGGIMAPFHRVYDQCRVQDLMDGWNRVEKRYWAKQNGDDSRWAEVPWQEAFTTQATLEPTHYYALAGFVLEKG
jgi:SAM-dependent methyltransferase